MAYYCCQTACPGYLPEPYHLPGYTGHIPSARGRNGETFGRMSRDAIEDPCTSQAPIPVLQPPMCCPDPCCRPCRVPVGCADIGCCGTFCCPPERPPQPKKKPCEPMPLPCLPSCCDPRAHHLNRSPYACPCEPGKDDLIYRCCEHLNPSYAGHVPGNEFHGTGRTFGKSTWGIGQYVDKCLFFNTHAMQ